MTKDRIAELRKEVIEFRDSDEGFDVDVVSECLDEIDVLTLERDRLLDDLSKYRAFAKSFIEDRL